MQLHFAKLIKLFENNRVIRRVNTDAGIADADLAKLPASIRTDALCANKDRAAVGCEFDGIDNDIVEGLFEEFGIREKRRGSTDSGIQLQLDLTCFQIFHIILSDQAQDRTES